MRRSAERRQRHESAAASERTAWFAAPPDAIVDQRSLADALRSLPEEEREVIVARIWGGLSFEEVAAAVGTSRSTAYRRYESGLKTLRERLGLTWLTDNSSTQNSTNLNAG